MLKHLANLGSKIERERLNKQVKYYQGLHQNTTCSAHL